MAFDLTTAEPISEVPTPTPSGKGGFDLSTATPVAVEIPKFESSPGGAVVGRSAEKKTLSPAQQKTLKKSRADIGELISATGVGAGLGAMSPELLSLAGAGLSAFPLTAPIGVPVMALGTAARGARLGAAGLGAMSGFGAESGEKIAEGLGAGKTGQEVAGFVGGGITPEFAALTKLALKKAVASASGLWSRVSVDQLIDAVHHTVSGEKPLTPQQRKFVEEQVKKLRGGTVPGEAESSVHGSLTRGAEGITNAAESEAQLLRQQATEQAAGIRYTATQEADKIRSTNSAEANRLLADGEAKAKAITDEAERRLSKMEAARPKIKEAGSQALDKAKQSRSNIGQDRESSEIGRDLRDRISGIHSDKIKARTAQYDADAMQRDIEVNAKEELGEYPINMPDYKNLLNDLKLKLASGKKNIESLSSMSHTDPSILRQYQTVLDSLNWQRKVLSTDSAGNPLTFKRLPPNFNAVDEVRRRLGEAAFGAPAGGFEAIGQNEARNLYKRLSNVLGEYAPKQKELIGNYESAAKELDIFKSKAGAKATAMERFDPKRFRDDPATLPGSFFRSKQSVADLTELANGDAAFVERLASDHVANSLRNKDAGAVRTWVSNQSDWLSSLPQVKARAEAYAKELERAERIGKKTSGAVEKLMGMEPKISREAAAAVKPLTETTVPAKAAKLESQGERLAERTMATGEKEAGKALSTAESAATETTKKAQDRAKLILGDAAPERRIEEIILSGSPKVWEEVGPIIAGDPQGKKAFAGALRSVMAGKAEKSPGQVAEIFRKDVRPFIEASGLLPKHELELLQKQINDVMKDAPDAQKLSRVTKLIVQAVGGSAGSALGELINPFGF